MLENSGEGFWIPVTYEQNIPYFCLHDSHHEGSCHLQC
jgi:hypothetical protein